MDSPGKSFFLTGIGKLLSEGPFELLTHIQLFLDPVDILALRFTCKHLSGSTRSRIVWMNAVRNVSIAQGVFLPMEQMSRDDLEHAALSPGRLQARFQKADRTTPFLTRLFTPHLQGGDLVPNSILTFKLVPGGRFLITSDEKGEFHLWDIGYNAGGHMKIFPIATFARSEAMDNSYVGHIGPASNSDSLYVFIIDQGERISYYEIYPTSEDPHFSRLGTLSVDGFDNQTTVSKDYLVSYQDEESILTVWKYTGQGLGASWVVSHPGDLYGMFIFDKTVITFHDTNFCLWTIPDLTPLIDGRATLIELEPKLQLAYLSVNNEGPKVALPSPWLPALAQNQFGVYYDKIRAMPLYQIKSIGTLQEPDLPNILPMHSSFVQSSQSPFHHEIGYLGPLHKAEGGFLQTWLRGSDITIGIISKPSSNNPTCSFVTSSIWTGSGKDVQYDFCPMTGRLIVLFLGQNGLEIQIVDFILPRSFL